MDKVNIIIVANKNNYHLVNDCLISMYEENRQYKIIVANNGTPLLKSQLSDNSYDKYIEYMEPYTYGYVLNDIIENENLRKSDLVLINAGMGCKLDVIEKLKDKAYTHENIGIVSVGNSCGQVIVPSKGIVFIKSSYLYLKEPFSEYYITEEYTLFDFAMRSMYHYGGHLIYEIQFNHRHISFPAEDEEDIRCDRLMLEREWKSKYFNTTPNLNIVNLISPAKNRRVNILEVGCDLGATLLEIKKRYSHYDNIVTYGIEPNRISAIIAAHAVDHVSNKTIEEIDMDLIKNKFDYIIFGDVLEHLTYPEKVLYNCREALKANGKIIASIPNLMHISVMKELLKGNFTYTDRGLLDKTHCHLFTKKEIVNMFSGTGYEVKLVNLETSVTPEEQALIKSLVALSNKQASESMYKTFQYLCIAKKQ